ncbi:MAG: hypothetical protein ABIJ72_04065 [bacterium]
MSDILAKLFGSASRVKIIRLFLLNPNEILARKDISTRAKVSSRYLTKEINVLINIGFLKKKTNKGFVLNPNFPLFLQLKDLVLSATVVSNAEFLRKMTKIGRLKLVILAGIFIRKDNSRVDLLIVGDKIRKNVLTTALKELEAEVGKELSYAVFETDDFMYRVNMYDKFIRDILDYPHQKLLNKLGV